MRRLFLVVMVLAPAWALAQTEDLENPGRMSAVQERAYRMQHELDLGVGVLPLDAFYKGFFGQVGYTFHFNDVFAWQVGRGGYSQALRTGLREQLERDFGVLPTSRDEVEYFAGSDLLFKPLYGKFAVMNRYVVHAEGFLLAGGTLFHFTHAFRPGVRVGGGVRVFATRNVSFRFDVTDDVVLPTGGSSSGFTNVLALTLHLAINFGATE